MWLGKEEYENLVERKDSAIKYHGEIKEKLIKVLGIPSFMYECYDVNNIISLCDMVNDLIKSKDLEINILETSIKAAENALLMYENKENEVTKQELLKQLHITVLSGASTNLKYTKISDVLIWTDTHKKFLTSSGTVELHNTNIISNFDDLSLSEFINKEV